jgi:hypothetical protein
MEASRVFSRACWTYKEAHGWAKACSGYVF